MCGKSRENESEEDCEKEATGLLYKENHATWEPNCAKRVKET